MKIFLTKFISKTFITFWIFIVLISLVFSLLFRPQFMRSEIISENTLENVDGDSTIDPSNQDKPAESFAFSTQLIIKAINPGYKIDNESDVGELIELQNLSGTSFSLAGFSLYYTNGSNRRLAILDFPEGSSMTGETLLLTYSRSPSKDLADLVYSTSIGMKMGPLELVYNGEVVDSVCWTGKEGCEATFSSDAPTTLVRNLVTGTFEHQSNYDPAYSEDHSHLIIDVSDEDDLGEQGMNPIANSPHCRGLEFTEIFAYYSEAQSEQFVELYNSSGQDISLDGCKLRYKNKNYNLVGEVAPDTYFAYYPGENFSFTKNPSTSNRIELVDADDTILDELIYLHGQKKMTSYARFFDSDGAELWLQTYNPTPASENIFQEFKTCPVGKVINPLTGNCISTTSTSDTLAACPEGKYRNPLTGRCKNIESSNDGLTPCAEGYERNPETNRCRKIKSENNGTDFAIVPTTSQESKTVFVAFWVVAALVTIGIVYIVLQFRREIARAARKIRQRLYYVRKH